MAKLDVSKVIEACAKDNGTGFCIACGSSKVYGTLLERSTLSESVKAGLERAKAEGKELGRPRKAFDYEKAVSLRQRGWGYKRIADELGVPRTTVYRYLKDTEGLV